MTTKTMTPEKRFRCLMRARNTLLWVVSEEERRAERAIGTVAAKAGYQVRFWDCATGASDLEDGAVEIPKPENNPKSVFAKIRERDCREIWVLRDLHHWLKDPTCERGLKSLAREVQEDNDRSRLSVIVVLSPEPTVPAGLRGMTTVLEWPLPSRSELEVILDDILLQSGKKVNGDRESVIDAAAGLTAQDAESALAYSIVLNGRVDPATVADQKKLIIDREQVLTWFEPDSRGLDAIGGLYPLKTWLNERRLALSPEARSYGLPVPKGVLLVGVPGCGKSLTAKAMPTAWGIPLLRMDIGALRSKYVGESEQNLRKALRVAEAVAPVVLWLDEIEKSIGSASGRQDGGVAADAVGTILTWLQEKAGSVFVVATANDVSALPPEMTRKGRFDEIFFVDLPTTPEREAILATTLVKHSRMRHEATYKQVYAKVFADTYKAPPEPKGGENATQVKKWEAAVRNATIKAKEAATAAALEAATAAELDLESFDCLMVASKTAGFSGAEVAELIPSAMFSAFADGQRLPSNDDLLAAVGRTVPISKSAKERIEALREWSESRARPASDSESTAAAGSSGRAATLELDVDED